MNEAAEDNWQVVYPSTPAQYFHVLRRQVKRTWRKPLVVLTPKSLLRHPQVVSPLEHLSAGGFQRILPDTRKEPTGTGCVLMVSGKIYYELAEFRDQHERSDVAILRIEQFYPLSDEALVDALDRYADDTPVRWVQEEPKNMGAWPYWKNRFCQGLLGRYPFSVIARATSASPSTGSSAAHKAEQKELIEHAFEPVS